MTDALNDNHTTMRKLQRQQSTK